MSITSALYAGASGITAMSRALQVIGNNIANINTVGFKGSRAAFADVLSQAINTPSGKKQIGRGVQLASVQSLFHQGSFESTAVVTDCAIDGAGFFRLSTDAGEVFYSRAGEFRVNKDGMLVNGVGMFVNGYVYDPSGNPTNVLGKIDLSSVTSPPNPTGDGTAAGTGVFMNVNLCATTGVDPTSGAFTAKTFSLANAAGTSDFSTSLSVYDSLGVSHTVVVYFTRTSAAGISGATSSDWDWHATVDGAEIVGGTAGNLTEPAHGTLKFDTSGRLTSQTTAASSFSFTGGSAANQAIGFDFSNSSQVGTSASVVNALTQDGYSSGALQAIDIDRDGVVTGVFSNGVSRSLSRLAIATFPAEDGLFRTGNSLFIETPASGQAVVGAANTGNNGTISASTLELSNVDMSQEFVGLITTERAYQANTKVVSTSDSMLETLINMKR